MLEQDPGTQETAQLVRQGRLYAALNQVSVHISSLSDSRQIMECIGNAVLDVDLDCAFALFGPGDDPMTVQYVSMNIGDLALTEVLPELGPDGRPIVAARGPLAALQENQPIFAPDLIEFAQALLPNVPKDMIQCAVRAYGISPQSRLVCLPLPIVDHLVGAMGLFGPSLTQEDLPMLSLFANLVTCAIKGAQDRELLQDVIDAQGEGIGIVDRDECFLLANPAAEAIFGVPSGALAGRCLLDFVAPENQSLVLEQTQRRQRGLENTYELDIVRPDGARRHLLVTATPRTDRQGLHVGAYGIFRDDTERFAQKTKLLGAYSELEDRVAARTAELLDLNRHLEREVAERQRRAEELEREVSEHARTEAYLQDRNRELALFSRSIHALSSALDTEHVLESIIDQVQRLLDIVACSVWLLDPEAQELVCQQAAGYGDKTVLGWRLPIEAGIVGAAARTTKTINVPDTRHEKHHYKTIDDQTGVETRSIIAVPLQAQGRTIGVLEVVDDAPNRFSSTDVTLVELMALSAANALENARVHEVLQSSQRGLERRNQDLLVLNAISTIVGRPLNLEQTLAESLDTVLEMTRVDAGWIGLFGPEHLSLSLVVDRGLGADMLDRLKAAGIHSNVHKAALLAGEPMVVPVTLFRSDLGHGSSDQLTVTTLVAVPIRAREKMLGVLGGLFYRTPDIDEQDVQLLSTIGHQLGAAVENVRLLEEASEIEALRSLDTMRSELIATASHELRTPLGLIRLFATALLMDEVALDVETSQQFLSGIADETEKLEHILDDLLDLSRMESGRLLLDRRLVDLVQLTEDTLSRMSIELEGHPTKTFFDERPLMAVVDPVRIEQVLRNLLNNAVKYSDQGTEIVVRGWHAGVE